MAYGNWPVATLRQRAVYKTEFDIFKQNTDIDLISLLSYEEHAPRRSDKQSSDLRPRTVPDYRSSTHLLSSSPGYSSRRTTTKRIQSAYNQSVGIDNKNVRTGPQIDFKRSSCIRSNTSVYKAFARTSRSFLKQKQNTREPAKDTHIVRQCNSALDFHKPSVQPSVRSQTTCGFRQNERNFILAEQKPTQDVTSILTHNRQNNPVNKTEKSILKHIWRTKSASLKTERSKCFHINKPQPRTDDCNSAIKKRNVSAFSENKQDECFVKDKIRQESYTCSLKAKRRKSEDVVEVSNQLNLSEISNCESGNCNVEDCEDSNRADNTAQTRGANVEVIENQAFDNEKTFTKVNEQESVIFSNSSEHNKKSGTNFESTVHEDGIGSKDSGFASNAVSPELELSYNDDVLVETDGCKHVKFLIDNQVSDVNDDDDYDRLSSTCDIGNSDVVSETESETENKESVFTYDINTLISDLERFSANSRLSVISAGGQSNYTTDREAESLCGDTTQKALDELREAEEKAKAELEEQKELNKTTDIESLVMSKEARHAIMETLKDMGSRKGKNRNKENGSANSRYKGVNAQKRQNENRHKYEYYMRERTKSVLRNQFRSMESVANEDNSSTYSSPRDTKDCENYSNEDYMRGKRLPSIRENTKLSKTTTSTSKSTVMALENAKKTKYKIPGIGNYQMIASPENDFEITPPGFDSRYNQGPAISKEEMEIPPRFIRERSIEKCKSWLTNINLSPLSLRPAKRNK